MLPFAWITIPVKVSSTYPDHVPVNDPAGVEVTPFTVTVEPEVPRADEEEVEDDPLPFEPPQL
jgi:hypothetical protein